MPQCKHVHCGTSSTSACLLPLEILPRHSLLSSSSLHVSPCVPLNGSTKALLGACFLHLPPWTAVLGGFPIGQHSWHGEHIKRSKFCEQILPFAHQPLWSCLMCLLSQPRIVSPDASHLASSPHLPYKSNLTTSRYIFTNKEINVFPTWEKINNTESVNTTLHDNRNIYIGNEDKYSCNRQKQGTAHVKQISATKGMP